MTKIMRDIATIFGNNIVIRIKRINLDKYYNEQKSYHFVKNCKLILQKKKKFSRNMS